MGTSSACSTPANASGPRDSLAYPCAMNPPPTTRRSARGDHSDRDDRFTTATEVLPASHGCTPRTGHAPCTPLWRFRERRSASLRRAAVARLKPSRYTETKTDLGRGTLTEMVGGLSCDPELPHLGDQGRSEETESRRRAISSTHHPVRVAKDRDDVRSLGIHERARAWNRASCVHELGHRCLQLRTFRQNH